MVLDIHCPEILQSPGKFAGLAPNVGWKEEGSWNFTITQMIAYVGRAYCKEHTIPVVKTVAPFLRDFPFHIHSRLPINAVQFTILSIIAMVYKPAVAHFGSELSSIFLANFDYATIDKTLFYEIFKIQSLQILNLSCHTQQFDDHRNVWWYVSDITRISGLSNVKIDSS